MEPGPATDAQEPATPDEAPVAKRPRAAGRGAPPEKPGPSVDGYTPQSMSMEAFRELSRNQQKKVMRQEMWDRRAAEFKDKQRQRRREGRRRHKQRVARGETPARRKPSEQTHSGVHVVLDMAFDDKMCDKEIKSVCSQVRRCYAVNRQAAQQVDLHVTRLHGQCQQRLAATTDYSRWSAQHVVFHDGEYLDLFDKQSLVYLTADSPNVVDRLEPGKMYIIGGIVDKNRYPRLTLDKAEQQGIAHAQLPIGQYVRMATRRVVTVNQIFEMLIGFIQTGDWKSAFLDVIPQRKLKDVPDGCAEPGSGEESASSAGNSDSDSGSGSGSDSDDGAS